MSNTNERTPRTLLIDNTAIQVEELAERLPFARKPADLSQVRGREYVEVYITVNRPGFSRHPRAVGNGVVRTLPAIVRWRSNVAVLGCRTSRCS